MNALSLYELNTLVSQTLAEALPEQYWVEAELLSISESRGHCYMQLVQKDINGATPVAQASAACWKSQWAKVGPKFFRATGGYPKAGMKLLLRVRVNFHPNFGFQLVVNDIDPTYTIGDMALRRQEIIQQLKDEGIFDLQRELRLPLFCQRIAVISSESAAGYGDFCNQLVNNEYGFKFEVTLFPAIMQGDQVEQSVCAALDSIYDHYCKLSQERLESLESIESLESLDNLAPLENIDGLCVVIIRGGGAVADLSGFDTLLLAEHVANFPIPIITGIGHDRDESILDMVSHQRVKTPTAAAAFLIDRLATVLNRVETAQSTILSQVTISVERQRARLESLSGRIVSVMRLYATREDGRLERLFMRLTNALSRRIQTDKHRLEMLHQRLEALNPELLLKRGYSMTLCRGQIVKDASLLRPGDEIETKLQQGTVVSIVKENTPKQK